MYEEARRWHCQGPALGAALELGHCPMLPAHPGLEQESQAGQGQVTPGPAGASLMPPGAWLIWGAHRVRMRPVRILEGGRWSRKTRCTWWPRHPRPWDG